MPGEISDASFPPCLPGGMLAGTVRRPLKQRVILSDPPGSGGAGGGPARRAAAAAGESDDSATRLCHTCDSEVARASFARHSRACRGKLGGRGEARIAKSGLQLPGFSCAFHEPAAAEARIFMGQRRPRRACNEPPAAGARI